MSRILVVVPPLVGHVLPTVSLGAALTAAGHEVTWVGHAPVLDRLLPDGARRVDVGTGPDVATLEAKGAGLRGAAAFKFLWEDLFWPLADAMVPPVQQAVDRVAPDVVVVDQQALAGAIVAQRAGLPWATSAATSAALVDPLEALPSLRAWMHDGTDARFAAHGVPGGTALSPHAVLAFTTRALVGPVPVPDPWHFVGPVLGARRDVPFPWDRLTDRPTVLVTLGTVSRDRGVRFQRAAVTALGELGLGGVVVADPEALGPVPDGVIAAPFVPQLDLLPHMDAVVCHAGHNTVVESLWHDLPLVVAPVRDDQPVVAHQVVQAGAGLRVKFGRVSTDKLGAALDRVRTEAGFRAAAARIGASFRDAGGADAAAQVVAGLSAG